MLYSFRYSISILVWMMTSFMMYLIISGLIAWWNDMTFRQASTGVWHTWLFIFVYWWLPAIFIACETYEYCEKHRYNK